MIEYPAMPSQVTFSGKFNLKDPLMDLEAAKMETFQCAGKISIASIHLVKDQAIFVDKDETIWGMGAGQVQGTAQQVWLRKINKPEECKDY